MNGRGGVLGWMIDFRFFSGAFLTPLCPRDGFAAILVREVATLPRQTLFHSTQRAQHIYIKWKDFKKSTLGSCQSWPTWWGGRRPRSRRTRWGRGRGRAQTSSQCRPSGQFARKWSCQTCLEGPPINPGFNWYVAKIAKLCSLKGISQSSRGPSAPLEAHSRACLVLWHCTVRCYWSQSCRKIRNSVAVFFFVFCIL